MCVPDNLLIIWFLFNLQQPRGDSSEILQLQQQSVPTTSAVAAKKKSQLGKQSTCRIINFFITRPVYNY